MGLMDQIEYHFIVILLPPRISFNIRIHQTVCGTWVDGSPRLASAAYIVELVADRPVNDQPRYARTGPANGCWSQGGHGHDILHAELEAVLERRA